MHHLNKTEETNYNNNKKERKKVKNNSNKNRKFLSCFGPPGVMNGCAIAAVCGGEDPVIECVKMGEKDGVVFSKVFPADLSPAENESGGGGRKKKKSSRKSLTRVLKAVLFETSLAKKIKKRKLNKLHQSNGKSSAAKFEKDHKPTNQNSTSFPKDSKPMKGNFTFPKTQEEIATKDGGRNTNSNATSLPTSEPGSMSQTCRSNSIDSKLNLDDHVGEDGKGSYNVNAGLCLVLLSLLGLVLWGKICAILCTSTWLFFVTRWKTSKNSHRFGVSSLRINTEGYKKKVVLGWLLERNRHRGV